MSRYNQEDEDLFYEIEYDSGPFPGVGRFVQKSRKIDPPVRDEIREQFSRMRDIARNKRTYAYRGSGLMYNRKMQQEKAEIFYEQGMFMKDFEDAYPQREEISSYYPDYQMMGYDQLRTYFTWRTQVRRGIVENISVSCAFLYIYELLNNIGAESPNQGLEQLLFFWREFRSFDSSLDSYVIRWLKDYYVYYDLPGSFQDFTEKYGLQPYYPAAAGPADFELYCSISGYDIRKSAFYKGEHAELVQKCFREVLDCLRCKMQQHHMSLDEIVFHPTRNLAVWTPFSRALFWPRKRQQDRQVVLSENEVYLCRQNQWFYSTTLTTNEGKKLIGYVMKQTEAVLRKLTRYPRALTADIRTVNPVITVGMAQRGIPLERLITDAVTAAYREATRTVVKVDRTALEKIRQEADETREKLTVPDEEMLMVTPAAEPSKEPPTELLYADTPSAEKPLAEEEEKEDPWAALSHALTAVELEALCLILCGAFDSRQFADKHGMMPEVLMDAINEKAVDFVGDSLLDDEFMIYDDYMQQVKEMVGQK